MPVSLYEIMMQPGAHGRYQPAPEVQALLSCFMVLPAYQLPARSLAFSDGRPAMAFMENAGGRMAFRRGRREETFTGAWASSQCLEDTRYTLAAPGEYLLVACFHPWAFAQFFREGLHTVPEALCIAVQACSDIPRKIKAIENFVAAHCNVPTNYLLAAALARIDAQQGRQPIAALAAALRVHQKWLERSFLRGVGVSPKTYAGARRFLHAYLSLRNGQRDLCALALDHGYCDQQHLRKDFRKYTGLAPLQLTFAPITL